MLQGVSSMFDWLAPSPAPEDPAQTADDTGAAPAEDAPPSLEAIQLRSLLHSTELDRLIYEMNAAHRATRKLRPSFSHVETYDMTVSGNRIISAWF